MKRFFKSKKGFTLVELLAVVAIMAIVAAIAIPAVLPYLDNAETTVDGSYTKDVMTQARLAFTELNMKGVVINSANVVEIVKQSYVDGFPYLIVPVNTELGNNAEADKQAILEANPDIDINANMVVVYVSGSGLLETYFFSEGAIMDEYTLSETIPY